MTTNIGLLSYSAAALVFGLLTVLLLVSWRGRPFGTPLIICTGTTGLWAFVIGWGTTLEYPPVTMIQITELLRGAAWVYFLLRLTSWRFDGTRNSLDGWRWTPAFVLILAAIIGLLFIIPTIPGPLAVLADFHTEIMFSTWLGIAILVLFLLEQIFRNASESELWSVKYLCLGLGGLFAYDFFMYAEALLFQQLDPLLWQARGIINALATPLLAVAIARNSNWDMDLHVSRKVVFHTVTLVGAGIYMLAMAIVGYFIQFVDGDWGGVLQISFLAASGALLVVLLFSGQLRAKTRVLLSKHFFSYKYDYREEWLKFTQMLADIQDNVPEGIIRTMASLVSSPAGMLWASTDDRNYSLLSNWEIASPASDSDLGNIPQWMLNSGWVIDLDEYRHSPDIYRGLELPQWLKERADAWLLIPLIFDESLQGIVLLKRSELQDGINWEDRDLLKTSGRQAASHLAQYLGHQQLLEARQFDAFNRLSAYVIHDLKNILAQQSLMVANADKHKSKPEFVDDMIVTVRNSVARMTNLMDQMRSGERGAHLIDLDLGDLLQQVVDIRSNTHPQPQFSLGAGDFIIRSDWDRLSTVFGHLIQNAQEASDKNGLVQVRLQRDGIRAIIEIQDNGRGMDSEFIKHKLFRPFESTKGLTGMGIGVFESREFIRSQGGDIQVESSPGTGSLFRVTIPCVADRADQQQF